MGLAWGVKVPYEYEDAEEFLVFFSLPSGTLGSGAAEGEHAAATDEGFGPFLVHRDLASPQVRAEDSSQAALRSLLCMETPYHVKIFGLV